MNLDRLKKGEIFFEDDYKRVFVDFNKHPDTNDKLYISERFLKEYLDKSDIKKCLRTGAELAAKIIQKIGARLN
jgi:uncharacterized protein (DUF488 family)